METVAIDHLLAKRERLTPDELRQLVASFRLAYDAVEKLGVRYRIAAEALFRDLSAFEARLERLPTEWTTPTGYEE